MTDGAKVNPFVTPDKDRINNRLIQAVEGGTGSEIGLIGHF